MSATLNLLVSLDLLDLLALLNSLNYYKIKVMIINTNATTKILKYSIWGCLYLALLTPLWVNSRFLFPFITPKTIYFRILIEIAVFLYLLLALSNSYYRPKMNKLIWFILGFGLIVFITALLGVNPYRSFWSTIERGEGFLFISHLIVFCFIISQVFKTRNDWYNFLTASVFVNLIVGLYAVVQYFGISGVLTNSAGARWSSTLGNPSYLGAYSLGHFWISILLFWQKRHIIWKIFFILTGLFNVFLLFQTSTRGAMIGFLFTFFIYCAFLIFFSKNRKIKIAFATFLILLIFAGSSVYLTKNKPWITSFPSFERLVNISLTNITVESRLYALDSSLQGWKDRFLFGYGWENYNIAFNKYFHPEIYRDKGSQIWFDRAHNTILDVAIASGLIGLIAYLGIYLTSFIFLIKLICKNHYRNFKIAAALMAFLAAHFIQNIFVFDSLPTYIMLFMCLGFIAFLAGEKEHSMSGQDIKIKPLNFYVLPLGAIILIIALFAFNIQPVKANLKGIQGLKNFYLGDIKNGIEIFDQAIQMNTYHTPELRQKAAENILNNNNKNYIKDEKEIVANFDFAIQQIKANIDFAPLDVQNHLYLMALYNSAANATGNAEYLNKLTPIGKRALELSPTRPQIYFEMGRAAITLGQIDKGLKHFERGVELNPKTIDSHWNLLTAYIITGRKEPAEKEYQIMLKMGVVEDIPSLERLAQIYSSVKNYPPLIPVIQKLIYLNPDKLDYWTKLAAVYKETGDLYNARKVALEIIQKFPETASSIEQFLKNL